MSAPRLRSIDGGKVGDDESSLLRELYSKYGGMVFGRCQYLLRDRALAEDTMQDVFAKVLQAQLGFRNEASPLTWLMKITTHHCLNVLRGQQAGWRQRYERDERAKPEGHGGPTALETRDFVRSVLGRFDDETQAAVIHYYVDEMTLEEVAELLGRSIPTIRKRLRHFADATGQELLP